MDDQKWLVPLRGLYAVIQHGSRDRRIQHREQGRYFKIVGIRAVRSRTANEIDGMLGFHCVGKGADLALAERMTLHIWGVLRGRSGQMRTRSRVLLDG